MNPFDDNLLVRPRPRSAKKITPEIIQSAFRQGTCTTICRLCRSSELGQQTICGLSCAKSLKVSQAWQRLLSQSTENTIEINMYEWSECLTMETIGQSECLQMSCLLSTKEKILTWSISGIWCSVWCHRRGEA